MNVSEFDFELPSELIAQHPLDRRDASRMLVVGYVPPLKEGGTFQDKHIADFISYLCPGDVVVFNNSRVIPARFIATAADGAEYEITLHTKVGGPTSPRLRGALDFAAATSRGQNRWWGFAKKFQKLRVGETLQISGYENDDKITVIEKNDDSGLLIQFPFGDEELFRVLDRVGKMPLPPYMKRDPDSSDRERYQTVYADPLGSMAAPTAGLHFTPELIAAIHDAGADVVNITLHVGAGTWAPMKSADTDGHKMHSEWGVITSEQADIINAAHARGGRVFAIGTTSLRLLESAAITPTQESLSDKLPSDSIPPHKGAGAAERPRGGPGSDSEQAPPPACDTSTPPPPKMGETRWNLVAPFCGDTDIFITPGYKFGIVDVLLTNFHLPKSTLFMLVAAFAGLPEMKAAYAHAIAENYRFFSYGDCCLLFRKD